MIWRVAIVEKAASLNEILYQWDLEDLQKANSVLDISNLMSMVSMPQQENKIESNSQRTIR